MLSQINSPARNIITVEDPVEYPFDVLNQVQVNEKAGLNFANVLRNILRQDPDVLMIGEIRDRETADIAIRSALTGHLVLSTLHTNDAITTATRLIDMGVEPFLLGSALLGMISQRLVRLLCAKCKVPHEITDREAELLGSERVRAGLKSFKPNPSGCAECQSAGFRGRTPLFEMLVPDKVLQRAIADRKSESEISQYAQSQLGYRSMREDAIDKLLAGVTSFDEIIKATS
jgi:type IV pilus assembly protein PilB